MDFPLQNPTCVEDFGLQEMRDAIALLCTSVVFAVVTVLV